LDTQLIVNPYHLSTRTVLFRRAQLICIVGKAYLAIFLVDRRGTVHSVPR